MGGHQQGFIMLAVIWVLLAMLAGVALFSHWVHGSLVQAQQRQQQLNARIAGHTALNAVLYVRLLGRRSVLGFSVPGESVVDVQDLFDFDDMGALLLNMDKVEQVQMFPFDNRVWSYGQLRFVAQDSAGLIGLTHYGHDKMLDYMLRHGPTGMTVSSLSDSYLDYRDADGERRPAGAEAFDYRAAQRALPLNGALRTPLQLRDVMHWDRLLQQWSNGDLLYRFRVAGGSQVNVNSASPRVLELVLADKQLAQQMYTRRLETGYSSVFDLPAASDSSVDASAPLVILPRDGIRFWWWIQDAASAWVYELSYDGMRPGMQALRQDWQLRVDIPDELSGQAAQVLDWEFMPTPPDYLGR